MLVIINKFKKIILNKNKSNFFIVGLFSSLSFAPFYLFPIIIFSYCYLISSIRDEKSLLVNFKCGLVFGLGQSVSSIYWIAVAFEKGDSGGIFVGTIAVFFLSLSLATFTALAVVSIKIISNYKKSGWEYLLTSAIILCFYEWLKGNAFGGFPWNPLSSIWAFSNYTLKPFSYFGTWLYSLVTFIFIAGISYLHRSYKVSFLFILPLFCVLSASIFTFNETSYSKVSFRAVQPNIPQNKKWDKNELKNNFDNHMKLSNYKTDIFSNFNFTIWPETAIPFSIENNTTFQNYMADNFTNSDYLISGAVRKEIFSDSKIKLYNSMYFLDNKGITISVYDKASLVPFGEYIPLKSILPLKKLTNGFSDFSKGSGLNLIKINNLLNIGSLICYEVIFPGKIIKNNHRPDVLVNITNDAWYGVTSGPYQHLAHARMRAVEYGVPLIRVANSGISALISPNGNIVKSLSLNERGVIDSFIPNVLKPTIYSRFGDNIFWIIMFLSGTVVFFKKIRN